ncbi:MAG: ABC transporter substrate-binding protein [Candidatus Dormibacteria bacterium]
MTSSRRLSFVRTAGVAGLACLFLAACASTTAAPQTTKGGTVTFAEGASAPPNYILPLESGAYFSGVNLAQFSQNMYLPLYWFGNKGEPVLNQSLSLAYPPVFSHNNSVATITLKNWQWSNGTPITARDVVFWVNLLSAATDPKAPTVGTSTAPGPGWGAAVPGGFPQNVVSYRAIGTNRVQFNLNGSYNPTWYTYNELSQIYPLPQQAWDELSSSGPIGNYDAQAESRIVAPSSDGLPANSYVPADPGTGTSGALGVAQFLNSQSQDLTTYSTNPLWQVVDGPFKLRQFTSTGFVKMVPNKNYSGFPKPTISAFEELPFTTGSAEFNALRSGSLSIGYIPIEDLAQKAVLEKSQGYRYNPWYNFGMIYFPYNFTDPTVGPIFRQLYFRQAFQSLINQPQYIKHFMAGIGTIHNGPVPGYPLNNPDESSLESKGQIYPYSPTKAVRLLKANGWRVTPGGTTVCGKPGTAPGDCGPGIAANLPLTFNMVYGSGIAELQNMVEAMQSTMKALAGITLNIRAEPFQQIIGTAYNNCTFATPCSNWQLPVVTNGGWSYAPDYFPTGGELLATGSASNVGDYSNPTNDANIRATHTAPNHRAEMAALFKYENYVATQLPLAWLPNAPYQLTMYKSNLGGLLPQGIYEEIYPQMYTCGKGACPAAGG